MDGKVKSKRRSQSPKFGDHNAVVAHTENMTLGQETEPLLGVTGGATYQAVTGALESANASPIANTWPNEHDFDGLPWYRTPSVYWLLPVFAIFTTAFGGTIVPKIELILSLVCRRYFEERTAQDPAFHMMPVLAGEDNPQCRIPAVQASVSRFTLYGTLISGLLSALMSPKLGKLSDRYGRTRMIALTSLGMLVSEAVFIVVATYPYSLSVNWILFGYIFDGLGGTFIAAMALSYAYAADCTAPENRNVIFGYYHGCLFAGIAAGPILAGYVVKLTGNILSIFYVALGCHIVFFLFVMLALPESLTKDRQRAAREKAKRSVASKHIFTNDFGHLYRTIKASVTWSNVFGPLTVLWPTGPGTNPAVRRNLFFLAAVDTTMFGIAMGSMTVILIYTNYMFGWNTFKTSIYVSVVNATRVTVLLLVLPGATRIIRGPRSRSILRASGCDQLDLGIIRVAIFFDLLGYIGYVLVRDGNLFIACGILASLGGMGSPTLQSALTKHVPHDRVGQVLGAMGLLHSIARVVAPTVFNLIYAQTVGKFDQTVFVCLAATFGLAFIFAWCVKPHVYWDEPTATDTLPQTNNGEAAYNGSD